MLGFNSFLTNLCIRPQRQAVKRRYLQGTKNFSALKIHPKAQQAAPGQERNKALIHGRLSRQPRA